MSASGRDHSVRTLLETLKKATSFQQGLIFTVVPRGGLQLAQPSGVPDALLKSYARGFESEDRLSWQAIVKKKPAKGADSSSSYAADFMQPEGLKYAVAFPLSSPVLAGYPGAVHLLRSADEGDFSAKEIDAVAKAIDQLETKKPAAKGKGKDANATLNRLVGDAPAVSFVILDGKQKAIYNAQGFNALDQRLREQLVDAAKRRGSNNGHGASVDRVQIGDSHGDAWVFNVVNYRRFPALGDGSYSLICRQPSCADWLAVKPQDFAADNELSRLIPSLKYMEQEFAKGPTLVDIAKQVHLSPFHYHRRFTDLLGLTPKEFMLECQIHEAKAGLVSRDKDLADIAKECGFAHQSHFTSRFKQTTGLTPTRWRRMVAERAEN